MVESVHRLDCYVESIIPTAELGAIQMQGDRIDSFRAVDELEDIVFK